MANPHDKPNYKLHGSIAGIILLVGLLAVLSPGWEGVGAAILLLDAIYAMATKIYDPSGAYRLSED